MVRQVWRKQLSWLLFPLISGCGYFSHQTVAPVTELNTLAASNGLHIVQRGETLYEIAWKYGWDYRSLATANHIVAPYVIYPGQKLTLKSARADTISSSKPFVPPVPLKTAKAAPPLNLTKMAAEPDAAFDHSWDWPVKGKIVKGFANQGLTPNKGIDIAGLLGMPVKAAGKGKVVYSGAGLRGYGQLLIIKHNDTYLSAYAHNSRLLVKEGDQITKGQVIAHMGQSESQSVRLHFEIRKNGQPINPMLLLPK